MSITALVDRGLQIRDEMEQLKAELEQIETALINAGLNGPQVDLVDAEREGKRYLARGSGRIVPVIFTADELQKSFASGSPKHTKLYFIAGNNLGMFYQPTTTFKMLDLSGKKFRERAAELLGDRAPEFVTACKATDKFGIPKSSQKVDWINTEPVV